MPITIIRRSGKARRWTPARMRHHCSGNGKGKWQCYRTLVAYKRKSRKLRKIAADSRRRNRVH